MFVVFDYCKDCFWSNGYIWVIFCVISILRAAFLFFQAVLIGVHACIHMNSIDTSVYVYILIENNHLPIRIFALQQAHS